MSLTIAICSAGRRVELVRAFQSVLAQLPGGGRVLACDASQLAAAGHVADEFINVPPSKMPEFLPAMLALCGDEQVDLLVPTTDTPLMSYAQSVADFARVGTTVAISSPQTVGISADKVRTWEFFCESGIRTVRQYLPADLLNHTPAPLPLIVKPRFGSSSVGVTTACTRPQLELALTSPDVVVQEVAGGTEYTIDLFFDSVGTLRDCVPRERIEVRAGEVSKSRTNRADPLLQVAEQVARKLPPSFGVLNLQVFWDGVTAPVAIEINARFGGGFPLSHAAGAPFVRWLLECVRQEPLTPAPPWEDGLLMLRYDSAVLVRQNAGVPR